MRRRLSEVCSIQAKLDAEKLASSARMVSLLHDLVTPAYVIPERELVAHGCLTSHEVWSDANFNRLCLIQTRQQDGEFDFSDHMSAEDPRIFGYGRANSFSSLLLPPVSGEKAGVCE